MNTIPCGDELERRQGRRTPLAWHKISRVNEFDRRYVLPPDSSPDLTQLDPRAADLWSRSKEEAIDRIGELSRRIGELQELLYAEGRRKVLVLLQGTDTSGKDGTIRHVFGGVTPVGVRVVSFKKPTEEELAHDFLWRVHPKVPGSGELVIFNRSHYEDVLVVRVRGIAPEEVWRPRYEQIRNFEHLLTSTGTVLLKFFLHISKEEQRERLQARIDDPKKHWKFEAGDLDDRKHWDDYRAAFEEALRETSTEAAPWFVIPADRKWYRNLSIAEIVASRLEALGMKAPSDGTLERLEIE